MVRENQVGLNNVTSNENMMMPGNHILLDPVANSFPNC